MAAKIYRSPFLDIDIVDGSLTSFLFSNPFHTPQDRKILIDASTGEYRTYKDVCEKTDLIAHGLADLGVGPGKRVAIFSPNSIDYPIFCYSIIRCGATASPINSVLTWQEVRQLLELIQCECFFVHPSLLKTAIKAAEGTTVKYFILDSIAESGTNPTQMEVAQLIQRGLAVRGSQVLPSAVSTDAPAFTCFSSGTTGKSKGVLTSHRNMISNVQQWQKMFDLDSRSGSTDIAFLPFSHIYAVNLFICGGLFRGNTTVVLSHFDWDLYLSCIDKYKPRDLYLVPPVALRIVTSRISSFNLSSVEKILSAAAPLSIESANALESKFKKEYGTTVHCHQSWGLTETTPIATAVPPHRMDKRTTVGCIVPNMEFRFVDHVTGEDIQGVNSDGSIGPGEIWCRGPNVTEGYLDNRAATEEAFTVDADGKAWFRTGDIASMDSEGFITILDRIKEMIKYKGLQVIPSELEGKLLEHDDIEDCGVTALYDENQATELPVAFVVLRQETRSKPSKDVIQGIHNWLNSRVANYKRLRGGIYLVDEIPKSPSGKILRRKIKDKLTSRQAGAKL